MDGSWRLETRTVVAMEGVKTDKLWTPTQKQLHGSTWLLVSKWDRGFVKFVKGKALNLKGADCNVAFLDELKRRRQEVCDDFLQQALQPPEEANDNAPRKKPTAACCQRSSP